MEVHTPSPALPALGRSGLLLLVLLVTLSACLQLVGLNWGLGPAGYRNYHPDELPDNALKMLAAGSLRPQGYIYGSFHTYCILLVAAPAVALAEADPVKVERAIYLTARLLGALMGVACVGLLFALVWLITANLAAAFIAAASLVLAPLPVNLAHYATTDIPVVFWSLLALVALARAPKTGRYDLLYWAALAAGFASSIKLSAGLLLPLVLAAHFIGRPEGSPRWPARTGRRLAGLTFLFGLTYYAGTPYALVEPAQWFAQQVANSMRTRAGWDGFNWGATYPLDFTLAYCFGPALLLSLIGIPAAFARKWRGAIFPTFAFGLLTWLLFAGTHTFVNRYRLPVLPACALLAGFGYLALYQRAPKFAWVLSAVLLAGSLTLSVTVDYCLVREPRDAASAWLVRALDPGDLVEVTRYGPVLPEGQPTIESPYTGSLPPSPEWFRQLTLAYDKFRNIPEEISLVELDKRQRENQQRLDTWLAFATPEALAARSPDWIVVSSLLTDRFFMDPDAFPTVTHYYQLLLDERLGYEVATRFDLPPFPTWVGNHSGEFLACKVTVLKRTIDNP